MTSSLWIRHTRSRYMSMQGLWIVEIERMGTRWHTTLTSIISGEIVNLETRSPLSVAIQQAEKRASEHSETHLQRGTE